MALVYPSRAQAIQCRTTMVAIVRGRNHKGTKFVHLLILMRRERPHLGLPARNLGPRRFPMADGSGKAGGNTVLSLVLGAARVALAVLGYLYYQHVNREVVKIDVPGFSGEISKDKS